MKLSDYAKQIGVSYRTAWRWYKAGKIKGRQMATGTIIITEDATAPAAPYVAIYARIDDGEEIAILNDQAERLVRYCTVRGYQINQLVKEVGSGACDTRPRLLKLLANPNVSHIVVQSRECLAAPGFCYIEALLAAQDRRVEVVNLAAED